MILRQDDFLVLKTLRNNSSRASLHLDDPAFTTPADLL
jgi:hypothetical protein